MKAILLTTVLLINTLIAVPQSRRESSQTGSSSGRKSEAAPAERRSTSSERVSEPRSNTRSNEQSTPARTSESNTSRPAERTTERRTESTERRTGTVERTTSGGTENNGREVERTNSGRSSGNSTARPSSTERTTTTPRGGSNDSYNSGRGSNESRDVNRQTAPSRSESSGYSQSRSSGNNERRVVYSEPRSRSVRVVHRHVDPPRSVEVRRVSYPYRAPVHVSIVWNHTMYRDYRRWYPHYTYWNYPIGYNIPTISAYDAIMYPGEVSRVYGQVHEVFYSYPEDDYYLYFGAPYPHHDFSIVVPGREARRFSRLPERYFEGRYLTVTGLITFFEDRPEIIVKRSHQISFY